MTFDIFGLGNAIVDNTVFVSDDFLKETSLSKGSMKLVNAKEQVELIARCQGLALELKAGGSVANSIWSAMASGARVAFSGKVSTDEAGLFYKNEFTKHGIEFPVSLLESDIPTGTCLVLTSPDAERTMSTNLSAAIHLSADDLDLELIATSKYLFCEGYLWTQEPSRKACLSAFEQAKKAGVSIAFSYSDPFVVEQFRDDFRNISKEYCDLIFCNALEASSLAQRETALSSLEYIASILGQGQAFVTLGREGSLICDAGNIEKCPSKFNNSIKSIDSNGAGDAFAGGVLHALSQNSTCLEAACWGNFLGAELVQIHGARLDINKKDYKEAFKRI